MPRTLKRVCTKCGNLTNEGRCHNCAKSPKTEPIRITAELERAAVMQVEIVGYSTSGLLAYVRFGDSLIRLAAPNELTLTNEAPQPGRCLSYLFTTRSVTA